jgi:hypothetical protein
VLDDRGRYPRTGLWSRDQTTFRILSRFTHRRKGYRPEPGQAWQVAGRTVTVAAPKLPYGRAVGKDITDRTVTHHTDLLLMAWRDGVLLGSMALWLCGATTTEPRFEETVESRLCQICWMRSVGPPIVINNSIVLIGQS